MVLTTNQLPYSAVSYCAEISVAQVPTAWSISLRHCKQFKQFLYLFLKYLPTSTVYAVNTRPQIRLCVRCGKLGPQWPTTVRGCCRIFQRLSRNRERAEFSKKSQGFTLYEDHWRGTTFSQFHLDGQCAAPIPFSTLSPHPLR